MCSEMSQYIPSSAVSSETAATADGTDAQPGRPETRSPKPPRRRSHGTVPERCPSTSQRTIAVATVAPPVAMITWSIGAPPAGSLWAKGMRSVSIRSSPGGFLVYATYNRYIEPCNISRRKLRHVTDVTENLELTIDELARR